MGGIREDQQPGKDLAENVRETWIAPRLQKLGGADVTYSSNFGDDGYGIFTAS